MADVLQNGMPHRRAETECDGEHVTKLTKPMKKFVLQQDDCGIKPKMILSLIMRDPDIPEPTRGYPSLSQVIKHVSPGTPFSVKAVMGDAEDAQYNAFASVNRKLKAKVVSDIMALHYATDSTVYYVLREQVVLSWAQVPALREFSDYFSRQWMYGRYSQRVCLRHGVVAQDEALRLLGNSLNSYLRRDADILRVAEHFLATARVRVITKDEHGVRSSLLHGTAQQQQQHGVRSSSATALISSSRGTLVVGDGTAQQQQQHGRQIQEAKGHGP
ncbi:hypothetical protein ATCC90586_004267 [Pythium insidiosum]|nr:hypothetical protein ATCC90586_004267 [Pythium insidiosum]